MCILQHLTQHSRSAVIILADNEHVYGSRFGRRPLPKGCDHTYTLNQHIDILCYLRRPEYYALASDQDCKDWAVMELCVSKPVSSRQERFRIDIHNQLFKMVEKEHYNPNNILKNEVVEDLIEKLKLEPYSRD